MSQAYVVTCEGGGGDGFDDEDIELDGYLKIGETKYCDVFQNKIINTVNNAGVLPGNLIFLTVSQKKKKSNVDFF